MAPAPLVDIRARSPCRARVSRRDAREEPATRRPPPHAVLLAMLDRVSRPARVPRSYASALAFSASNSSCVIAPESSSSLAFAISAADPPPAVSRT